MKLLKLTSVLLLLLLFYNCGENEIAGVEEEEREEVIFSSMMNVTETQEPTTRGAFPANTSIKLVARDNTTSSFFAQKTVTAETDAESNGINKLTLDPKLYWDDLGGKSADLKFIGIYPAAATLNNDLITWDATSNQSAGVDTYDLMTALKLKYKYTDRATAAHLPFEHALTKVTITLKENQYFDVAELNGATVQFNVKNKGDFDVLKQEFVSASLKGTSITPLKTNYMVDKSGVSTQEGYSFTILTMPFKVGDNLATVTLNGNEYYIHAQNKTKLEAGVHTHYIVTISKVDISAKASIVDWTTPAGIPVVARIVGLEDFNVDGTNDIKITEGSKVTMLITDSNSDVHESVYEYQKIDGAYQWVSTTHVYWDDITDPVTKVKALLKLGGTDTGEAYLVGEKTGSYPTQSNIDLGNTFFSHPLSKISIKIETTSGADKVNLEGITNVFIPGCGTFKVSNDKVSIEKYGSDDQIITGSSNGTGGTSTEYNCIPAFIWPQTLTDVLCKVSIQEDANNLNEYTVYLPVGTDVPDTGQKQKTFVANTHYKYTITIKKSDIAVTCGITDWVDGGSDTIGSDLND
ncbi:fimbrillin family protein [Bacteroides sp. OttesenSCG-928-E20]|nr:fimbrillin family protein [Bacteroides sp. OttesenSCG-928-N06]MDL2299462.1 fimbrillin family protein [Bacteroides sp. OttesenSCG-928-E20]